MIKKCNGKVFFSSFISHRHERVHYDVYLSDRFCYFFLEIVIATENKNRFIDYKHIKLLHSRLHL